MSQITSRLPLRLGTAALWCYPVMLVTALYTTWLVAWAVLGHQPQPSMNDPKYISFWVDIPYVTRKGPEKPTIA